MAKISAHGAIIGTVDYATWSVRYMSDGKILINKGHGWKIGGKVKDGATPAQALAKRQEKLTAKLAACPAYAAYRKLLHDACGLGKRWKLQMAITVMPDDADGVWSEACDGYGDNVSLDVGEVAQLCAAYKLAEAEAKARAAA